MAFGIPATINTSTDPGATGNTPNNLVTIANDGTALCAWFDGTNQQVSYASAPYNSWTETQLMSFHRFATSMLINDANGDVSALACDNVSGIDYIPIAKSGTSYSVGSPNYTGAGGSTFNAGGCQELLKDSQGRYWLVSNDATNAVLKVWFSSNPASGLWTQSLNISTASNANLPAADIVGNFLVVLYSDTSSTVSYRRLDVSGVSLGSWSSGAQLSVTGFPGATSHFSFRGNGSGVGVFVYSNSGVSGHTITSLLYTASNDTWGSPTDLSTSANDDYPTIVNASGDLWVFWCQYAASNSYALVWTVWRKSSSSWDISTKTLIPAGSDIFNPNAGFCSATNTIGIMYSVGTGSPYSVEFVTVNTAKPALQIPNPMTSMGPTAAHVLTNDSAFEPASYATDSNDAHLYRGSYTPAGNANSGSLAVGGTSDDIYVDLSNFTSAQRQWVLVYATNSFTNADYVPSDVPVNAYNLVSSWTIYTNSAPGGSSAPVSGWTSRTSVSGWLGSSYMQVINMSGDNWLRFSATAVNGSSGNNNVQFKLKIFDIHNGLNFLDAVIMYGDSITAGVSFESPPTIATQINALNASHYPIVQDGGIPFATTTTYLPWFAAFLQVFCGNVIFIRLGTNDANQAGSNLTAFPKNLDAMIKMGLAKGCIVIVPTIPYGLTANLLANASAINADIRAAVAANPGCYLGDDAYSLFANNPSLISGDGIHPTTAGYAALAASIAQFVANFLYSQGDPNIFAFDLYHFGRVM